MKLPWVLFGLLICMCLVVGSVFVVDEEPPGRTAGFAHDQYPAMDQGGPGRLRHGPIIWIAWAFATLQTVFLVTCLALGIPAGRRRTGLTVPLGIGGLLLVVVVTMMFVSYARFMTEPSPDLVLGFPAPTAWYLYGFWPVQLFFVVLYIVIFSRTIVGAGDRAAFDAILAARRQHDSAALPHHRHG